MLIGHYAIITIFISGIHIYEYYLHIFENNCYRVEIQWFFPTGQPIEMLGGNRSGSDAEASPIVLMTEDYSINHVDGTPAISLVTGAIFCHQGVIWTDTTWLVPCLFVVRAPILVSCSCCNNSSQT